MPCGLKTLHFYYTVIIMRNLFGGVRMQFIVVEVVEIKQKRPPHHKWCRE